MSPSVSVAVKGDYITVNFPDNIKHRFHAMWLRDNSLDPETRAQGNGQRLITLGDIPSETHITLAQVMGNSLKITFAPEEKPSRFQYNGCCRIPMILQHKLRISCIKHLKHGTLHYNLRFRQATYPT